jgi:hypothetical protein
MLKTSVNILKRADNMTLLEEERKLVGQVTDIRELAGYEVRYTVKLVGHRVR